MRRRFWYLCVFLFVLSVVSAQSPGSVPAASPSPAAETTAEPELGEPILLWFKATWLENLGRDFALHINNRSARLADLLGDWSKHEIVLGITWAKLILGLLIIGSAALLAFVVRFLILKYHSQGRTSITQRYWRNGILFALRRALTIFLIVVGAYLALSPLLPHLALTGAGRLPFAIASKLAAIGMVWSGFTFFFHLARLIRRWLVDFSLKSPPKWHYAIYPLIGRMIYYDIVLAGLSTFIYILDLPEPLRGIGYKIVGVSTVLINTWLAIQAVIAAETMVLSRSEHRFTDSYKKRRLQTQARVIRQLLVFVIAVIGIAVGLMNFEAVRQLGAGILASAGVAGVIVGLAAQKSLSTIIAGLQIALTQPVRIDDVVIVEGEYGNVEEITLTYVVVRTWDQRRMILPITYFLEKPFQDWTRNSSELIGAILLYVDFQVPIEDIREEAHHAMASSPLWDRRCCVVQVTDVRSDCVEIRILTSAGSAPELWDLRCEVREKLLRFLQERLPDSFPRFRANLTDAPWPESHKAGR
jgi:small-conductance mechanosensitive channel